MQTSDELKAESAEALYEAYSLMKHYCDTLSRMDTYGLDPYDWESVCEAAHGIEISTNLMIQGLRDRLFPTPIMEVEENDRQTSTN